MSTLRIGQAAELMGVSPDTVRRWADEGRLATTRSEGGQRLVDGADLARFVVEWARHADAESGRLSARNRFHGLVTRVQRDGVMAQVELQAGPHRIVSLMTAEAADDLGLEPGVVADAVVKSTNVIMERR